MMCHLLGRAIVMLLCIQSLQLDVVMPPNSCYLALALGLHDDKPNLFSQCSRWRRAPKHVQIHAPSVGQNKSSFFPNMSIFLGKLQDKDSTSQKAWSLTATEAAACDLLVSIYRAAVLREVLFCPPCSVLMPRETMKPLKPLLAFYCQRTCLSILISIFRPATVK